jgi:hypothetical protein
MIKLESEIRSDALPGIMASVAKTQGLAGRVIVDDQTNHLWSGSRFVPPDSDTIRVYTSKKQAEQFLGKLAAGDPAQRTKDKLVGNPVMGIYVPDEEGFADLRQELEAALVQ